MMRSMGVFLVLLLLAICSLGTGLKAEGRIVGGSAVSNPNEFPFVASITRQINFFAYKACGGSIVHEQWILTAAHCVFTCKNSDLTVYVGSVMFAGGESHSVEKIVVHPKYSQSSNDNDIALLKLNKPIQPSESIKKIRVNDDDVLVGTEATLLGWGYTDESVKSISSLHQISLTTTRCKNSDALQTLLKMTFNDDDPRVLCTSTKGHKGACKGDSGGPLISKRRQIGIVSMGAPCATGYPDIYTKVSSYSGWIKANLAG